MFKGNLSKNEKSKPLEVRGYIYIYRLYTPKGNIVK